jgi:hypothetical protein
MILDREFEESCLPQSLKVRVNKIIRLHRGAEGEYILYSYDLIGQDSAGHRLNRHKTEGHWRKPVFAIAVTENGGREMIDRVERYDEQWIIKYSPEAIKKIMALNEFPTEIGMKLKKGENGRAVTTEDADAFINEDFDSLYNRLNPESPMFGKGRQ